MSTPSGKAAKTYSTPQLNKLDFEQAAVLGWLRLQQR
jgi:hypothetical protein